MKKERARDRERQRFPGSNKQTRRLVPKGECSHITTLNLTLAYDAAQCRVILCMHVAVHTSVLFVYISCTLYASCVPVPG